MVTRVDSLAGTIRLADYLPERESALHEIGYDAISRRISMLESHLLKPPAESAPGHLLEIAENGEPVTHRMVSRTEDADDGAVTDRRPACARQRGPLVRAPDSAAPPR